MQRRTAMLMWMIIAARADAAPPVELEIVTERGVQITAPQEWLQLLTAIGVDRVRIRAGQPGEEPKVVNRGNAQRPDYQVVGVLTMRNELRLPGGTFSRADRAKLKDYFDRLAADGADAVTAPRVRFGLTEKEFAAVLADLAQPIEFETKNMSPREVIQRLHAKLHFKITIDAETDRRLRAATPAHDELKNMAAGTGLAITLRNAHLVFRPEKPRGQPVAYRVAAASDKVLRQSTLGKMSSPDMPYWPIGWEPEKSPGETAPALFESLNAEIDGYSLDEALAAIRPRLNMPVLLDRAAITELRIDPAKVQVRFARTRTTYKRLIDRILSQARLGSGVRVDEAGRPFLWITR